MKKIKEFLKKIQFILFLYDKYKYQKHKLLFSIDPKLAAEDDYKNDFKKKLNWENPKNIVEKNFWMQFNTDTEIWTQCTDKYLVREYVKSKGCHDILNKLYGKWDRADDIDFSSLPEKFVLKTNHGCGTVLVVSDKSEINFERAVVKLNKWLDQKYGIAAGQLHYLKIHPCLIAERYLEDMPSSGTLIDYKLFCFDGEVESICIHSQRNLKTHDFKVDVFDQDWNKVDVSLRNSGNDFNRPQSLGKMIESCKKLGKGIPFVRIDFYEVNDKAIFGEMTFTPGSGFLTEEYYDYLGTKLDIIPNRG